MSNITPLEAPRTKSRLVLKRFDELTRSEEPAYLVKGLVPRVGLIVAWGPPKCGKSFWCFDLAMHVALGWEYRGRRVRKGSVIYCALEGQSGFGARADAFRQRHMNEEIGEVPFYLMPTPLDLVADHAELIAEIQAELADQKPALIVLDTLNRSLRGSESSDEDMSAYVRAADAMRARFECAVLVIHHCGVSGDRPRGHTSLTGAADAQLSVARDGENVVVRVEWMKDGPEGEEITSRLVPMEVGVDTEGDPITSCVIEPIDGNAAKPATTRKLPTRQKLALDSLSALVASIGEALPPAYGLPGDIRAVTVAQWREDLFSRGVLDRDAKNPREDFRRVKSQLQARFLTAERDGRTWLA
jgi:AAA domain